MKRRYSGIGLIFFILIFVSNCHYVFGSTQSSVIRTGVTVNGGFGAPLGWWGDRWEMFSNSEINLRYETSPGVGILLLTGLGKAYLTELSVTEIVEESTLRGLNPLWNEFITYPVKDQSGSFTIIPLGFGGYMERMLGPRFRGYGSGAMVVYLWKVKRNQHLTRVIDKSNLTELQLDDDWTDKADGSNLGLQLSLGLAYQLKRNVLIDLSVAYNYLDIGDKYGAIAYWGLPARNNDDKLREADSRADFIQLRLGCRFGR